jgi:uncharacterized protein (DUF433 family)
MNDTAWKERISMDPLVCHGKACIKGTRVIVSVILDTLKSGEGEAEVLKQYPSLTHADVLAAMGYAAWLAHEEELFPLQAGTKSFK